MEEKDDARSATERASRSPLFRGYPPLADYPVEPATDELMKAPGYWCQWFDFSQQSGRLACVIGAVNAILLLLIVVILCL